MQKELLKNLRILYVEDEDDVRRNAVEYLKRIAKEVLEASDGKEAIKIWGEEKPDIIITDISMPRLNGLDMARYIRSKDQDVQIIVATAYTDTDYLMQAVELNLVKYLVKPITKEKLLSALSQSVEKIQDENKFTVQLSEECRYNAYSQNIECQDKTIKLTKNELLFMDLVAHHISRTLTYQEIEDAVWPYEGMSQDAIRSLVRALRKKLPEGAVENVSGVGYRLHSYSA
ncbi:MAG: response regulator [Helicobacteraceae bacterium]|jgi:two-component system response regulator VanR|nr:response regulator [Helicobacteraceae bacterium]